MAGSQDCVWAGLIETARTSALAPFFGHIVGQFTGVGPERLSTASQACPSQALGVAFLWPRCNSLHIHTKSLSNHQKMTGNEPPAALGLLCFNFFTFFPHAPCCWGPEGAPASTNTANALSKRGFWGERVMVAGWAAPRQCHEPRSWDPLGLRPEGCCDSLVYPVPSHPILALPTVCSEFLAWVLASGELCLGR